MPAIDPDIILMLCSLLGAGAIAGITTGLFGVGGGFIIVPTLLAILPMFTGDNDGLVHTASGPLLQASSYRPFAQCKLIAKMTSLISVF